MHKNEISAELRQFITDHVDSVHTLEVLLFLMRERDAAWNAEQVHAHVKSSTPAVTESLRNLAAAGLLAISGERYRYDPRFPNLGPVIQQLARVYAQRRTALIELIYSKRQAHALRPIPPQAANG